ncbi:glycosyltransferase family 4 protein [Sneathiella chinensis]|uniref:Colanic acid biosynthesis glycosyltransferase WcaL n=1 Tax=Sneathiella chinensis TaxID=349750 RepID=A0ABQ5U412_9PROT|nr:glycosyltransferase family 4 protein [Sneathiella chinensis]GLQ05231.1 colanic acid biosynthesis glycosyltransferase WcaL [Sneathiella chinensis]
MKTKSVIAVVLKGYPRLSETFIAQELLALEKRGHRLQLVSLRHPTDTTTHPVHDEITAPVNYLPEYLYQEPLRVLKAWWKVRRYPGYKKAFRTWKQDFRRDRTSNRGRRFGQALVLAAELPEETGLIYAHFLHTPASVARYASMIREVPWTCSAHAKDIWTSPEWELSEKLDDLDWLVTCTSTNVTYLKGLASDPAKVELLYHGLDLSRFDRHVERVHQRDGSGPDQTVQILSVGRAVAKKGYDDLLVALSRLPDSLSWHFTHIGGGTLLAALQKQAADLGLAERITWSGSQPQHAVLDALKGSDIFVLASRIAEDGDRDGLPNVLMEAQSQGVAVVSTRVSAIPELITSGEQGLLVEQRQPEQLSEALETLIRDPEMRDRFARSGEARLREHFDASKLVVKLSDKLKEHPSVN